ncbi:septum formation inhibitor Maf [Winogradskyella litorisediminis]|uniref:Septum formation inhibitor Maf n=1 Tax=Winogradskyella litorisediminis TaxID=1156618 RepID=A0ABW3N9S5_9FLAO
MKTLKYLFIAILFSFFSCQNTEKKQSETIAEANIKNETIKPAQALSKAFNKYWYAGEAEISSYKLEQARYGEIRDGQAVLVFVTEYFLPEVQVKADNYSKENVPVLKLNATKNFNTGIYPYSIMQSTFYPVANNQHAIKISASIQEWCGHVYAQLNNRNDFEIMSHSYFQSEADQNLNLEKAITENQLWTQLRVNPKSLPVGELQIIPSFEFLRLKHMPFKAYKASAKINDTEYSIYYPELDRSLKIEFNASFPYDILGWEETYKDGYGSNAKPLTTRATKLETIKSAYWSKNSNDDENLRADLELK